MTDITTNTAIFLHRPNPLAQLLPKLGISRTIEATSRAVIEAFAMAYEAPFVATQRKPTIVFDEDLEGRDPNW